MPDIQIKSIQGVQSAVNPLSAQPGSLLRLQNMVSDVPGWATKRRGIKKLNPTSSFTSVFSGSMSNANTISCWYHDDHFFVYAEDSGTGYSGISAYSMVQSGGWQKVIESSSKLRLDSTTQKMRAVSSDRRVLITTASGVMRISAIGSDYFPSGSTTPVAYSTMYRNAGIPRALDPRCRNAVAGGGTDHGLIALTGFEWLLLSSAVGYRITWFKRDENGIPGISAPSGRIVVRNTSTTTNYATRLKVVIPSGVTDSSYVMQIYRTNIISMDGAGVIPDPGDDMFLAGEYRLTSTDLSNGYVLYEDVSFDPLLGASLYTNENQEGPLASRFQPPLCRDIATFGGCSFFSNTTEKQRITLKILAVDSSGIGTYKGIRVGDMLVVGDLVMEGATTANELATGWKFAVDATTGAGSEVIRCMKTAESICFVYNLWSNSKNGRYAAYNITGNDDVFGVIQLEEKSIGGGTGAYAGVNRVDAPVQILPAPVFTATPSNTIALPCAVDTDVGLTRVQVTTSAAHNLTSNDLVFLAPFGTTTTSGTSSPKFANTGVPAGVYKITVTAATTYTFTPPSGAVANQTDARAATTGGYSHKIFDVTSSIWTEARSENNRRVNRLMWSSPFEPETAPIANTVDIGSADKPILRVVPTQDSMFIFKEDGVWRLKGESGDWEIIVLDKSCVLAAMETPAVVDGRVFCYSTNGIVSVDDGGIAKTSGPISGLVDNYFRAIASNPSAAMNYCGAGHGEDKAYWISFAGVNGADIYRYHCPTRTWSSHSFNAGVTNVGDAAYAMSTIKASRYTTFDTQAYAERLVLCFIGSLIGVERKTGLSDEVADLDYPATVTSFSVANKTVTFSPLPPELVVGDTFVWYANGGGAMSSYLPGNYGTDWLDVNPYNGGIVSAINGSTVTLTNTNEMVTWPAVSGAMSGAIVKCVRSRIVFTPIPIDGGFNAAHFSEVGFSVGSLGKFSSVTIGFNTENAYDADAAYGPNAYTSTKNGYGSTPTDCALASRDPSTMSEIKIFRSGIPRQSAMATSIILSIEHNRAWELFDLAGIRLMHSDGSHNARRTNA